MHHGRDEADDRAIREAADWWRMLREALGFDPADPARRVAGDRPGESGRATDRRGLDPDRLHGGGSRIDPVWWLVFSVLVPATLLAVAGRGEAGAAILRAAAGAAGVGGVGVAAVVLFGVARTQVRRCASRGDGHPVARPRRSPSLDGWSCGSCGYPRRRPAPCGLCREIAAGRQAPPRASEPLLDVIGRRIGAIFDLSDRVRGAGLAAWVLGLMLAASGLLLFTLSHAAMEAGRDPIHVSLAESLGDWARATWLPLRSGSGADGAPGAVR